VRHAPLRAEEQPPRADHLPGCPLSPTASVGRAPPVEPAVLLAALSGLTSLNLHPAAAPSAGPPGAVGPPPPEWHVPLRC